MECMAHIFGDTLGPVDLGNPLGHLAEHAPVVDFLEGFALDHVAAHLSDEQDHGRRVLVRRVHTDAGIGSTRPARDEADTRTPSQLAIGLRHESGTTFLAADDEAHLLPRVVHGIDDGEIALARDAECHIHPVDMQCVDQDLAPGRHLRALIHPISSQRAVGPVRRLCGSDPKLYGPACANAALV
jgi:hypothetical protein